MRLLAELLGKLQSVQEEDGTLLDRTMTLYGSNFGDANKHTTTNMPVLLAGGGFRHGRHRVRQGAQLPVAEPVREHGAADQVEADRFASSTGTLRGLEMQG